MKTTLNIAVMLCSMLLLMNHAEAGDEAAGTSGTAANPEPGVVDKVENAVERGAKATARGIEHGVHSAANGIERGAKATAKGIKRGADATAHGVKRAATATGNAASRVAKKITPERSTSTEK